MSEHNDTQEIQLLKQAFTNFTTEMRCVVKGLNDMYSLHKEDMDDFKLEMRKEIYGSDDANIGIKAKVTSIVIDRAKEAKDLEVQKREDREGRLWWRTLISVPIAGVVVQWLFQAFNYFSNHKPQ